MIKSTATQIAIKMLVVLTFVAVTSITLFYAFGYQYDYQTSEVIPTGIIKISQTIPQATVSINNEFVTNQTPFNISYLHPGNHTIRITKKGFHPWEQIIKVSAGKVNELKGINLIPENIEEFIRPIPETTSNPKTTFNTTNSLGYLNVNNTLSLINFPTFKDQIKSSYDINFEEDPKIIALDDNRLLIKTSPTDYQYFNPTKKTFGDNFIIPKNATNLRLAGKQGFYISNNNLFQFTLPTSLFIAENNKVVGELFYPNVKAFEIIDYQNKIFNLQKINQNFTLVQFNKSNTPPALIDTNIQDFAKKSPNRDLIAYKKNNELWIYDISKQTKFFITRFSSDIKRFNWHPTSNQILFIEEAQLKICDINFENCYTLSETDDNSPLLIIPEQNFGVFTKDNQLHLINLLFT